MVYRKEVLWRVGWKNIGSFDSYLNKILDILDENNQKATFFCVGRIAADFHYVIRKISERGHEIGCHSNEHLWLTQMTPKQLQEDTKEAIDALQDVSGQSVVSYRAPAFSIGEKINGLLKFWHNVV